MIVVAIVAYTAYKLVVMIDKRDTSIAKKSFYRDLDRGIPENYTLGESSFDFAFRIFHADGEEIQDKYGFFEMY